MWVGYALSNSVALASATFFFVVSLVFQRSHGPR